MLVLICVFLGFFCRMIVSLQKLNGESETKLGLLLEPLAAARGESTLNGG